MNEDPELERINNKHFRIRKSHELKYPGNESRCKQTCGYLHDEVENSFNVMTLKEHRCFLKIGHEPHCQFSSACGRVVIKRERARLEVESLADDGRSILSHIH